MSLLVELRQEWMVLPLALPLLALPQDLLPHHRQIQIPIPIQILPVAAACGGWQAGLPSWLL
jgi:hypothetical protein